MQPIKQVSLPKTSISKSYPLDVLYGPRKEGGLGMNHLYLTQGAMQLEKFQCSLGTDTVTGRLLQISLESAQLEIGIGRSIFSLNYEDYHFLLTDCWIKHLWKFTYYNDIRIRDHHSELPSLQRENNLYLMEIFVNEGYSKIKLKNINRCRQYLQVIMLSDVMNGYGDGFTTTYMCHKDDFRVSQFKWPRQPRPNTSSIKDWKSALQNSFGMRNGITQYTLGKWLHNDFNPWSWFFHEVTETLYQRDGEIWRLWKRKYARGVLGRTPVFQYSNNALSLPSQQQSVQAPMVV